MTVTARGSSPSPSHLQASSEYGHDGLIALPHGVSVIDTGFQRPRFDASYLLVEDGRAAIIDTGVNDSVPRLLRAVAARGLHAGDVDWLIVTHVHLDHAGGAGLLLQQLPNARLVAHPRGARHLIDPTRLMAGVRAVYGEEAARRDYGDLVPAPPERIVVTADNMVLTVSGRPLRFIHTPGHAHHHHCIWDEASQGWFTGDTLGVAYPELRGANAHYGLPTTTPVQFDPEALRRSIDRLLSFEPRVAYLTHFGAVREIDEQARMVLEQTDAMVRIARSLASASDRGPRLREQLLELYISAIEARGVALPRSQCEALLAGDVELNAQGLDMWLSR